MGVREGEGRRVGEEGGEGEEIFGLEWREKKIREGRVRWEEGRGRTGEQGWELTRWEWLGRPTRSLDASIEAG